MVVLLGGQQVLADADGRVALKPGAGGTGDVLAAAQHDAGLHPPEVVLGQTAEGAEMVDLFHLPLRTEQAQVEPSVVGQQEQPLGIHVQPPDQVEVVQLIGQQLHHGGPGAV